MKVDIKKVCKLLSGKYYLFSDKKKILGPLIMVATPTHTFYLKLVKKKPHYSHSEVVDITVTDVKDIKIAKQVTVRGYRVIKLKNTYLIIYIK